METRLTPVTGKGIRQYETNMAFTRPPELLTLDLYDGAIKFINKALEGFAKESNEEISNGLIRANAIIDELRTSLNYEKGGEIAVNFAKLYAFIGSSLTKANIKKDRKHAEDALRIISIMRSAWYEGVIKDKV